MEICAVEIIDISEEKIGKLCSFVNIEKTYKI